MKKTISFLLLIAVCFTLSAQQRQNNRNDAPCGFGTPSCNSSSFSDRFRNKGGGNNLLIKYKLQYIHGFIIPHSDRVEPLIDKHTNGVEFAVEFPKYGGKPWHFYYAFPTTGLGFMYLDLGNPDLLGSAFTLYPYIIIPIFQKPMFSFNFKMGAGLSYVTEKYDFDKPQTYDENNFAIGSHLNGFLCGGLNTEVLFSRSQRSFMSRFSFVADASLHHISNGSVQKPNTGLNMFNAGVGLKYIPYLTVAPMKQKGARIERKWSLEPVLGFGVNRQNEFDTKKYLNASLSVGGYRPLSNVYRFGLNMDMFYNSAFHLERTLPDYYAGENGKFRMGFSLANELMFGDFATGLHVGGYAFNPIEHDGYVYFKLVAKYRVYDHFFINLALKTHMQVAESVELGVGYSLSKTEKAPYSWIPEKKKKEKKKKKDKREY